MESGIFKCIVRTNEKECTPHNEEGVDTTGNSYKLLRYDEVQKRPPGFILKFEAGASYP